MLYRAVAGETNRSDPEKNEGMSHVHVLLPCYIVALESYLWLRSQQLVPRTALAWVAIGSLKSVYTYSTPSRYGILNQNMPFAKMFLFPDRVVLIHVN